MNKEKKNSTLQGVSHQKKIYREEKKLTYIAGGKHLFTLIKMLLK
jgi:hypothetical protein